MINTCEIYYKVRNQVSDIESIRPTSYHTIRRNFHHISQERYILDKIIRCVSVSTNEIVIDHTWDTLAKGFK